jgi:hypothetical protein
VTVPFSLTERRIRYENAAEIRRKMNFYQVPAYNALGYPPVEWIVYRKRYGIRCPEHEKYMRCLSQFGIER